ncbi:MAG: hypothetical protein EHM35_00295 [Planctomycetaceae bacterium]|nr:MAG: hypothetical protein EHM35_00295 [Planctomycetaceae bacterium]
MSEHIGPYQVGDLVHYHLDDPFFDTIEEARAEALGNEREGEPYGIWDDDGQLIAIASDGDIWQRE